MLRILRRRIGGIKNAWIKQRYRLWGALMLGDEEQPKYVIRFSRPLALAGCVVHIIPVAISIILICINLSHVYLGRTLPGSILDPSINIAFLQIAAKFYELLVQASLATVVIHLIRRELMFGEGVPLGMLGGGFLFSSLTYFWSPELWGSHSAKCSLALRCRLLGTLLLCGIIASLAGPSSAVLMIPREQIWNAGGTSIFLPNSDDQWWPDIINASYPEIGDACLTDGVQAHGLCKNGGYRSLWSARDAIDIFGQPSYTSGSRHNVTTNLIFGSKGFDLTNNLRLSRGMRYSGTHRGYACETAIVGTRTVEAVYHQQILRDWAREVLSVPSTPFGTQSAISKYKYYTSLTATTTSQIPAARVLCTSAQNVSRSEQDVQFPILDLEGCSGPGSETSVVNITSLSDSPLDKLRATWIDLPDEVGAVSAGLVLELPWDQASDFRAVVGCSIDARWAKGNIITSDLRSFSTSSNLITNFETPIRLGPIIQGSPTGIGTSGYSEFRPVISNPASRRIRLSHDWLYDRNTTSADLTVGAEAWNSNNLNDFLESTTLTHGVAGQLRVDARSWNEEQPDSVNRTVALEWILAFLVTDSLSRIGSEHIVNMSGPASLWTIRGYEKVPDFQTRLLGGGTALKRPNGVPKVVEEAIKITIGGYSYRASSSTDYLAIALLCTYTVLAITYTTYIVSTGVSSSAWSTLTELMVLMQNSRPAPIALKNASAGIATYKTYGQVARLYPTEAKVVQDDGSDNGANHPAIHNVELIFDEKEYSPPARGSSHELRMASTKSDASSAIHERNPSNTSTSNLISSAGPRPSHFERSPSQGSSKYSTSTVSRHLILTRVQPNVKYGHTGGRVSSGKAVYQTPPLRK